MASAPKDGKPRDELIRIMCPKLGCQRILAVPESARGKLVRCRSCGTNIRIPLPRAIAPEPPQARDDAKAA
jgi:ribosomal protein S27E